MTEVNLNLYMKESAKEIFMYCPKHNYRLSMSGIRTGAGKEGIGVACYDFLYMIEKKENGKGRIN